MNYVALFALVAVTYVRPAEIVQFLLATPIYLVTISATTLVSIPAILDQFKASRFRENRVLICALALLPTIVCSLVFNGERGLVVSAIDEFSRVILVYLIVVGALTTPARFNAFLGWVVVCIASMALIAILDFQGVIDLPLLDSIMLDGVDDPTTDSVATRRLQYSGLFNNPNAMSRVLVTGTMIAIYLVTDKKRALLAPFWLAMIGIFLQALILTKSRGGLLGFFAGMGILFAGRIGFKWAVPLGLVAMPAALVLFGGGRQTEFSAADGTGQHRIQLWQEGMGLLQASPLFGIGINQYYEHFHYVAHNSFVHTFVELGTIGGCLYVGLFYFSIEELLRYRKMRDQIEDPDLRRACPYVLALIGSEAVGMLSISNAYSPVTYLLLGIISSYLNLVRQQPGIEVKRFDGRSLRNLIGVGLLVLLGLNLFIKFSVRY